MKEKSFPNRINDKIVGVQQVRLVGDNVTPGVYSFQEAYKIADDLNLDLVEINGNQDPIICRILDYEKYLYEKKKREKENKQKPQEIKEIQLSSQINEHDFNFKLNHAIKFLKDNNKVKAFIFFKGRSINYKEQGEEVINKFCEKLAEYGKIEKSPMLEGKKLSVTINPK